MKQKKTAIQKIEKTIESCLNTQQIEVAHELLCNFSKVYKDRIAYNYLYLKLIEKLYQMKFEIF